MFLVEVNRYGTTHLVFTWEDPRKDGYKGSVVENVHLDYDMNAVHRWPDGYPRPEAWWAKRRAIQSNTRCFSTAATAGQRYRPVAARRLCLVPGPITSG